MKGLLLRRFSPRGGENAGILWFGEGSWRRESTWPEVQRQVHAVVNRFVMTGTHGGHDRFYIDSGTSPDRVPTRATKRHSMEDDLQGLDPRQVFIQAKVEHFLRRAEEFASMARFASALRATEPVLTLDPQNKECISLRRNMQEQLDRLRQRMNGENGGKGSNGTQGSIDGAGSADLHDAHAHRKSHPDLVLLVDQDEELLVSLTASLRRSGFETISAGTYEEAMELLTVTRPDLIISEVNFETGSRGFDLYLWVKTSALTADIPFMFLAARLDRDLLIAGKRFGVDDFILKPVDDGVVIASIQNCLARRRVMVHQA